MTRVLHDDIKELSIQHYVAQNFRFLGFRNLKGPFFIGPDFITTISKKVVGIEVERHWQNYRAHGHHKNAAFDNVEFLIVLSQEHPSDTQARGLPANIIYIETDHFVKWYVRSAKEYYQQKSHRLKAAQPSLIIELIAQMLRKLYFLTCQDKEREMAICPNCHECAYSPEIDFHHLALTHIIDEGYPVWEEHFSMSCVKSTKLNKFWRQVFVGQ